MEMTYQNSNIFQSAVRQQHPLDSMTVSWTTQSQSPRVSKCAKYYVCSTSFAIWGLSIIACCFAAWQIVSSSTSQQSIQAALLDPVCSLLLICSVVLIVSTFACTGSLREQPCCLRFFSACVILIVLCQLAIICLLITCQLSDTLCDQLPWQRLINAVNATRARVFAARDSYKIGTSLADGLEAAQSAFSCCGLVGPAAYIDWWRYSTVHRCQQADRPASSLLCSLPASCCRPEYRSSCSISLASNVTVRVFADGCLTAAGHWLLSNAWLVTAVLVGSLSIQLLAVCLACSLARQLTRRRQFVRTNRRQQRVGRTPATAGTALGYTDYYTLI